MAALNAEFNTALKRIEPSDEDKDHAPQVHEDVRQVLGADETLCGFGIDPILIGSYKRHVSIRRIKDVDVFCRLQDLGDSMTSTELLEHFQQVLDDAYGKTEGGKTRAKKQARSVQVLFPEFNDLYVDAVPARPTADGTWEIPRSESDDWQETNPDGLTGLSSAMNHNHAQRYVPTVKLLRQTRRALLGKTKPGGLYVELALYNACDRGLVGGDDNQAEFYASALEGAATLMEEHAEGNLMPDPTLDDAAVQVRAEPEEFNQIARVFRDAAGKARHAADPDTDRCAAALIFQKLLGTNGDGETVFPMPEDCTADGKRKVHAVPLIAGDRTVPAGDRRYG